jgi:hypothetical protein
MRYRKPKLTFSNTLLEAEERPWDFQWANLKEDHLIAEDVMARMQQRMRDFVANAHMNMLSDQDVRSAQL